MEGRSMKRKPSGVVLYVEDGDFPVGMDAITPLGKAVSGRTGNLASDGRCANPSSRLLD
jgi:hypothetical protein